MITETGKNLSVLIVTETGKDWETFATWYSVYRNLPDAKVAIACERKGEPSFMLYQWAKRLRVPLFHHNPFQTEREQVNRLDAIRKAAARKWINGRVLVVPILTMALDAFDPKILTALSERDLWITDSAWCLDSEYADELLNAMCLSGNDMPFDKDPICVEAKDTDSLACLVTYRKGCGKWINTLKGCPFSSAAGLASPVMTANENRIIELWKKMCSLYSALT